MEGCFSRQARFPRVFSFFSCAKRM
jgi:hypothetical protein